MIYYINVGEELVRIYHNTSNHRYFVSFGWEDDVQELKKSQGEALIDFFKKFVEHNPGFVKIKREDDIV